ncbi:hypothetical protein BGY98DRAFT_930017 [Russula aff. rugulosa BPL654]|nr:hypothetical protein BGY98DRAFT_930017 [Russula aff. rugulosa BPL654]
MNPPSPSPAQDDNLRRLLDQRAARVDIHHTRFPSLTEFSDSPSIYSHPHFSPRSPHPDSSPPQFDFAIPPQHAAGPVFNATTMRSLASSATTTTTTTTTDTQHGLDGPNPDVRLLKGSVSLESMQAEDEELESRMSFLGPTIQFHTLAPWETEDNITEGVEQEDDARSFVTKRGKSKTRGDGFIKGLSKPASTKATSTARPSIESTISRDKVSLDIQTAPSNLQVLLVLIGDVLIATFTTIHFLSRSFENCITHPRPRYLHPPTASPQSNLSSGTQSPIDVTDTSRPSSPLSLRGRPEFVHPYANPDLAYDGGHVNTATSYLPPSSLDYHADVLLKKVVGNVQGKLISGPLSTIPGQKLGPQPGQDKGQFALSNQVPTVSPTFNLISLQEAQAQARERSRTHIYPMPDPPFLQNEPPSRNNAPALPSNTGRMRSRTASASSKGKIEAPVISNPFPVPHSCTEDSAPNGRSAPPTRTLKQKKSGFMRLFNGKDKDKTRAPSPPPAHLSQLLPCRVLRSSLVLSPLQLGSIVRGDGRENDPVGSAWDQESVQQQVPALTIITTKDASPRSGPISSQSLRTGTGGSSMISGLTPDRGLSPASAPPLTTTFPGLSLRPISTVFSAHFADHIVSLDSPSTSTTQTDNSSTTAGGSGSGGSLSPLATEPSFDEKHVVTDDDPYVIIQQLQEQLRSTRKAWQHQIWELEGQELRGERCILCGRSDEPDQSVGGHGIVDRPRARTGVGTMRFAAAP